jgi:hypothetical protein
VVEGSFREDVAPFPKSHDQLEGLPEERSVKLTTIGEHPDLILDVKFATGD